MRRPKCAGPKCRRVAVCSGYCDSHRKQRARGHVLTPLRKYRKPEPRAEPDAPLLYVAPVEPSDDELERDLIRRLVAGR